MVRKSTRFELRRSLQAAARTLIRTLGDPEGCVDDSDDSSSDDDDDMLSAEEGPEGEEPMAIAMDADVDSATGSDLDRVASLVCPPGTSPASRSSEDAL